MKNGRLFQQFASVGVGSVINMLIGLITTPIITRLVDPADYGQLSLFNTYANITMMLFGLGFDQVLLRYFYMSDDISYKRRILSKCMFLPVLLFCTLAIPISCVYYFTKMNTSAKNMLIFSLFLAEVLCLLVNRVSILVVRLNGNANLYAFLNVVQKIVYVAVAIPLIVLVKSEFFLILVLATFISYFVPTVISIISERRIWRFNLESGEPQLPYRVLLKYGLPMLLSSSIYLFFQATDKLCLRYFCDYEDVGIYASAASLMSIIAIIRSSFTTVWTPVAVAHYEKAPEDTVFYTRINLIITLIMFGFGLSLMAGKDLLVLLLGQKYREASIILPFLMFQPIMYTISETTVVGLIFAQKSSLQLVSSAGACIFNLIVNICLIPFLGAKGASISTGMSYIVFYFLRTTFSNKYYPIQYRQGRFALTTLITIVYAVYTSVCPFSALTVLLYVLCLFLVLIIYRDIFIEFLSLIKSKVLR